MNWDFGQALKCLKADGNVYRTGWNGKGLVLKLQKPDENSKMSLPYIYIKTVKGDLVPWTANQSDVLANDWSAAP